MKKTGWQKVKNKTYYYSKKGIKVTSWKKIKGRYYYFDKKGELQKNKIVGNKKNCSIQAAYPQKQLYQIERKAYPFRLRIDHVYTMKSKNGKISWK